MQCDVVFIGGGIAGLMGATFSSAAGLRVVVLEAAERCGAQATGSNAASFSLHFGSKEICELAEKSLIHYQTPFWSRKSYVQFPGKIFLARKHQQEALERLKAKPKSNGKFLENIEASEAASLLAPLGLRHEAGDRFLFDPDHGFIDVTTIVTDTLEFLRKNEARVLSNARVTQISKSDTGWSVSHSGDGSAVHCKAVVNAAGAWSDQVAEMMGVKPLNLVNLGRTSGWFHVDHDIQEELAQLPMVHEVENSFFARPYERQWFISPIDDLPFEALDDELKREKVMAAHQRLSTWFKEIPNELNDARMGFRSFQESRLPEVSIAGSQPGLFHFTALGGYGIKIAPECARRLTRLLLSQVHS